MTPLAYRVAGAQFCPAFRTQKSAGDSEDTSLSCCKCYLCLVLPSEEERGGGASVSFFLQRRKQGEELSENQEGEKAMLWGQKSGNEPVSDFRCIASWAVFIWTNFFFF